MQIDEIQGAEHIALWVTQVGAGQQLRIGECEVRPSIDVDRYFLTQDTQLVEVQLRDPSVGQQLDHVLQSDRACISHIGSIAHDGSLLVEVNAFGGPVIELGRIEIGLDDQFLSAAAKKLGVDSPKLARLAADLRELYLIDREGAVDWFLLTAGPASYGDFEQTEEDGSTGQAQAGRESLRAFSLQGKGYSLPVKMARVSPDKEIFLATRLAPRNYGRPIDGALRLAKGQVVLSDYGATGAIRDMAAGAMARILDDQSSYLRAWDTYAELEGQMILERARKVGVIRLNPDTPMELEARGLKVFMQAPEELGIGDKLEIVKTPPLYLDDTEMKWKDYVVSLNVELAAAQELRDSFTRGGKQRKPKQERPQTVDILGIDQQSILLGLRVKPTDPQLLVLSLIGDRKQEERRMVARLRVQQGRAAKPNLGAVIEPGGRVTNLRPVHPVPALTEFVTRKIFPKNKPTDHQKKAVEIALNTPDIALIQGPPGTGKTTVIAAIVERLNEMLDKRKDRKGEIFLTAFQHDAVENMILRFSINSLPVPKFGGKAQRDEEASDYTGDRIDQWCEDVAQAIRSNHPELEVPEQQARVLQACRRYVNAPSLAGALSLVSMVRELPRGLLGKRLGQAAQQLNEVLEKEQAAISEHEDTRGAARRAASGLRTTVAGFMDDGGERAADVVATCAFELSVPEQKILESALAWRENDEAVPPVDKLRELKRALLERLAPHPEFRIEKPRHDVIHFIVDVADHLRATATDPAGAEARALLEFVNALESDTVRARECIHSYATAFAATSGQSVAKMVHDAKGLALGEFTAIEYDTVIMDEAARTSPRDMLVPMTLARRRIILVGDHRQLPHIVEEKILEQLAESYGAGKQSAAELASEYIRKSLFEHLRHRLDDLSQEEPKIKRCITLDKQFRMHPLLGNFVSKQFYEPYGEGFESPLPAANFVHAVPGTGGAAAAWLEVPASLGREQYRGTSRVRSAEAKKIADHLARWIQDETCAQLSFGVISFYKAQVDLIMQELHRFGLTQKRDDNQYEVAKQYAYLPSKNGAPREQRLRIGTVDSFQGMEFDVVFLSMVRSIKDPPAAPDSPSERAALVRGLYGHLTSVNRLCVSMSRQKKLLVVAGDSAMLDGELGNEAVPGLVAFRRLCDEQGVTL